MDRPRYSGSERWWALLLPILIVACDRESTAPPVQPPQNDTLVVRPGTAHVFGHSNLIGQYQPKRTVVEVVNAAGGEITILTLWDRADRGSASGLALSIDGLRTRTELISTRSGAGPWLPLTFWAGGREHWRLTPDGDVGIGTETPTQRLDVVGGVRIRPGDTPRPPCTVDVRGTMWFEAAAPGAGDRLHVCRKDANEMYAWSVVAG